MEIFWLNIDLFAEIFLVVFLSKVPGIWLKIKAIFFC